MNAQDDDYMSPVEPQGLRAAPTSPPPSFHSRASSPNRARQVNATLADAFDDPDDSSDDEGDDRQRLVRRNSGPSLDRTTDPERNMPAVPPSQPLQPSFIPAASTARSQRVVGGGVGSDGVFANMSARPERVESEKDEMPPTYEQAAADAAPPYWETTILAPGMGGPDDVYVEGMPVGSVFSFIWNCMISTSFQFVGFLLTYLLHSTHAAKNGSRAGLGITCIQYGFFMKGATDGDPPVMSGPDGYADPPDPNSHDFNAGDVTDGGGSIGDIGIADWMGYILMVAGWFLLIKSIAEFLRARRHEQLVLQSPDRGLGVPIIAEGESTERVV